MKILSKIKEENILQVRTTCYKNKTKYVRVVWFKKWGICTLGKNIGDTEKHYGRSGGKRKYRSESSVPIFFGNICGLHFTGNGKLM